MRSHSHLNTARLVLERYRGELPLAEWLRQFFRADKKYGSKDRRAISDLCFAYYRLGQAGERLEMEEQLLTALFLASSTPHPVLAEQRPEWNERLSLPLEEKLALVKIDTGSIFPFPDEVSKELDAAAFSRSMLVQPDLFLRLRPGHEEAVCARLQAGGIEYARPAADAVALPNGTKTEGLIAIDREAVVQDLSSQETIKPLMEAGLKPRKIWDACAASGGKSILLRDHYPTTDLTVSDIRESILANLRNRFERAGIHRYRSFLADVSQPSFQPQSKYDLVICDAPCSGSGTWGRTPEQLHFFQREKIDHYSDLQKKIARNAARGVASGGWLLYITCSVFIRENENVVEYLQKETPLRLHSQHYFRGYDRRSDTLFAALFSL